MKYETVRKVKLLYISWLSMVKVSVRWKLTSTFSAFLAQNSQFNHKTLFDVKKIEYNDSSGWKKCYKLTKFSSAINRGRFQLSPQFNSSRSSYDVILLTFQNVSQSKHPEAMDFAFLQVSRESIWRIFFRVKVQTETLNAFEYLQKRFLVPMRHDYRT